MSTLKVAASLAFAAVAISACTVSPPAAPTPVVVQTPAPMAAPTTVLVPRGY